MSAGSSHLADLASAELVDEALAAPGLLLVDVYTPSCVICRRVEPMVAAAAASSDGRVRAAKLDAERLTDFAARHNVRGVPHLLLFRDGELIDRRSGFLTAGALRDWIAAQDRP